MKNVKIILEKLNDSKFSGIFQFIKFGLVGVSNTAISYGIDMLGFYLIFKNSEFSTTLNILSRIGIHTTAYSIKVVIVTALAFIISVINSYIWNNRYVFTSESKKNISQHIGMFLRMTASYAFTGLILTPVFKILLNKTGMAYWLASLITLTVMVPINFFLNKFWAFAKKENEKQ